MAMQCTKPDFIWHLLSLAAKDGRVMSFKVCGPVLWVLMAYGDWKMIECYTLYLDQDGWDFKVCDEYQGFKSVSCPLLWLSTAEAFDAKWRAAVKDFHR
jgi:NAD-dependent oxidoreductase involved in siderophore biosynthesis